MVHTVLLDHAGYVVQLWQDTRAATLDARKYPGTLMEVDGPIAPGYRWDGQRFVLPPPRIPVEAVADERQRRIETYFPERFRAQVTALGGDNAVRMHRYVTEVHKVSERMTLDEPPQDFKDDHHWPTPPIMADMPVPVRHHEAAPVHVTVAPVINAQPVERPPIPLEIVHRTVSESVSPVSEGEFGLDRNDPLYALKLALVRTIAETVERHGPEIPEDIRESWEDQLAEMAAIATAATTEGQIAAQGQRVAAFVEGRAA